MGPEDPPLVPEDPMWWEDGQSEEEDPFLYPSIGEEEDNPEIL